MTVKQTKARILLIDDHKLFREGTARLLESEPSFEIAGLCGSVEEAIAILSATPVDLVLLDLDLRKERGLEFFRRAREVGFTGRVMVVAAVVGVFEARRLLQNGVAGIFSKADEPSLLIDAIRDVVDGSQFIYPELRQCLEQAPVSTPSREELSARDQDVWDGVVEGLTNKEIASRVHISEALVKVTLQQLFDKFNVRSRSQLVRIALEQRSPQS